MNASTSFIALDLSSLEKRTVGLDRQSLGVSKDVQDLLRGFSDVVQHLATPFVFHILLFWIESPGETLLCSHSLCENHPSFSQWEEGETSPSAQKKGAASFSSFSFLPLFFQGLPGIPGEKGAPGPAGAEVRGSSLEENL